MSANKELWQVEAERLGGPAFAEVMTQIRDDQRQLVAKVDKLATGFPGGDTEGHRRYHEAVIERIEQRNKLTREVLARLATAGALGGTGWLLLFLWQTFRESLK